MNNYEFPDRFERNKANARWTRIWKTALGIMVIAGTIFWAFKKYY